jgi:hypothetical protein
MSCKTLILFSQLAVMPSAVLIAQCDNAFQYPTGTLSITTSINTISTAQWAGDYNVTTGYINAATCTFSSSKNTDFITLRKASDNAVIATGITPVTIIYSAAMGNIEMHINKDAACATENINRTTTIVMNITDDNTFRGGSNDGFNALAVNKTDITDNNIFKGGNNDGFNTLVLNKTDITDDNTFRGGNDDGFTNIFLSRATITDVVSFRGGNDDGFTNTFLPKATITDAISFRGGNDDGFATILLNKINITDALAFTGGSGDGYHFILLNKININDPIAFTGGIGRGETFIKFTHTACDGIVATWIGNVNNNWENPANWDCGVMPNIGSIVIIPSAATFFPKVNFNYEIKKLILNNNSFITVQPGVLFKLNGP